MTAAAVTQCCLGEFFHANDCSKRDPKLIATRKPSRGVVARRMEARAAAREAPPVLRVVRAELPPAVPSAELPEPPELPPAVPEAESPEPLREEPPLTSPSSAAARHAVL